MAASRAFPALATLLAVPLAAGALTLASSQARPLAAAEDAPGKKMFLAKKCNTCHSIDSQSIVRISKSEKTKGPDLSNVGGTHLAPWIMQFLEREVAASDGKKHAKPWNGTDQELKQLADWLSTLKTP